MAKKKQTVGIGTACTRHEHIDQKIAELNIGDLVRVGNTIEKITDIKIVQRCVDPKVRKHQSGSPLTKVFYACNHMIESHEIREVL